MVKPFLTAALLLALILTSHRNPELFSVASNLFNTVMTPFESLGAAVSDVFGRGVDFVFGPRDQRERIEVLEAENAVLREKQRQQELIIARADFLEKEQQLKQAVEHTLIPASVTAMEGDSYPSILTINKGTSAGIQLGDMVVTAVSGTDGVVTEGIVGRISDIGATWARVHTIYDRETNISFGLSRTGALGIIDERKGAYLSGYLLDSEIEVKEGDAVVTTGMGEMFAPDILIGTVIEVEQDAETLVKRLSLETQVEFAKIYRVFVLSQGGGEDA